MKLLFVTDSYPPEVRSASHLMQELSEFLVRSGHTVTVLTCHPKYNLAGSDRPRLESDVVENGVRVLRIHTLPHHLVPYVVRGVAYLTLPLNFVATALYALRDRDLEAVLVYSPPLTLAQAGMAIARTTGARLVLNVQDLFPQNAIDLGVLKNKLAISLFRAIESHAYRAADAVTVHSKGNLDFIVSSRPELASKLHVVPNWIDAQPFVEARSTGEFRGRHGLEGKLIVLFAGVLGPAQGLDVVLRLARDMRQETALHFLFVGDGTERARLQQVAEEHRLENVTFAPFVDKNGYPALLNEVDVGLLSLSPRNHTPVVPGKLLGYMAASTPALAFLNSESDGHEIIRDAGCGWSGVSSDYPSVMAATRSMLASRDQHRALGERGLHYVRKHFSLETCADHLLRIARGERVGDHG